MAKGLYNPRDEHDACGVGFVADINGEKSHGIVEQGITVLQNLLHRGADAIDDTSGDGAGILVQLPHDFFVAAAKKCGIKLDGGQNLAVGSFFLPNDAQDCELCMRSAGRAVESEGLELVGWRDVPVNPAALGVKARAEMPQLKHALIQSALSGDQLERKLYVLRRLIEKSVAQKLPDCDDFYIPSLSSLTIIYKGMMQGNQLMDFYHDLQDESFTSAMAIVHQRYSTNTFPSWKLAQPFRKLAHNGEINTLRGNLKHMRARESSMKSIVLGQDLEKVLPVIDECGSDSGCLDNSLELLTAAGRDLAASMMILIPQAWGEKYPLGPDLRGFFEYYAGLMEPWDGPAALVCTDGRQIAAMLDRNGLRPARYTITKDGLFVLASETGALEIPDRKVAKRGALRPGQILLVDFAQRRVRFDYEIKRLYARRLPYRRWVAENRIDLHGFADDVSDVVPDRDEVRRKQLLFGYTREDIRKVVIPMAEDGREAVGAMGYDAPLAVLSDEPQLLYNYFKQIFSQVTNPAIDPIREELVMSLTTFMGNSPDILSESPENARLIKLKSPIISNEQLERLMRIDDRDFRAFNVPIGFNPKRGEEGLSAAIERVCRDSEAYALERSKAIIVLNDAELDENLMPIPALLAVSAVNQHLASLGIRSSRSIIIKTDEAREVHHIALLLAFGATAVNPRLAFSTVAALVADGRVKTSGVVDALENYIDALDKGLLKIMSKMGISTLRSYRGAQIFEAVGIGSELIEKYFPGTPSNVEGLGLSEVCSEALARFARAREYGRKGTGVLPVGGSYQYAHESERHLWTPDSISTLQHAARTNDEGLYRKYSRLIDDNTCTLRSLLKFKDCQPIPLEKVESEHDIVRRFVTSAMSFGSLSAPVHETLAIAMNRIGANSNSGEGGEDRARYEPLENGDSRNSAIKQIASGRFGVTAEYAVNARELQIKISQGAKPGEGGQLPGFKVDEVIARVRNSTPGVTLISPPPHHDIYSIEDIKQLIFDLKNVNPRVRVSVKLVSESGVGTVAAGVAKGRADMILISGGDGGTGAAPLTSIRHAGSPWEIGLAETHQILVKNNLRGNVRLQVDGQIKTGRDVVIGAMLGAEEFGFGTCPLIVCGCVMLRHCNMNNCSVGVATQRPDLCARYTGKPEHVVNFMYMVAREVREHMASLGIAKLDDLVGRSDLLVKRERASNGKPGKIDFSRVLHRDADIGEKPVRYKISHKLDPEKLMDGKLLKAAAPALERGERVEMEMPIRNIDRAVCTMLSGEIARIKGAEGLPDDTIRCGFKGYAGQSFAAFGMKGLSIKLTGEANDYVAKSLSGAKVVIVAPGAASAADPTDVICGNVAGYGATSGELYVAGTVGERFAVRNSGMTTVIEGAGDHCCEYMTGGCVVVLGETGVNFGAGMSGGTAYVYDPENRFDGRCNLDMVDLENIFNPDEADTLRNLIQRHCDETGSAVAKSILDNWEHEIVNFVKVFPMEYRRVLGLMSREDEEVERQRECSV